jgi:hypothetical protein
LSTSQVSRASCGKNTRFFAMPGSYPSKTASKILRHSSGDALVAHTPPPVQGCG